jgi:hypothetical protein
MARKKPKKCGKKDSAKENGTPWRHRLRRSLSNARGLEGPAATGLTIQPGQHTWRLMNAGKFPKAHKLGHHARSVRRPAGTHTPARGCRLEGPVTPYPPSPAGPRRRGVSPLRAAPSLSPRSQRQESGQHRIELFGLSRRRPVSAVAWRHRAVAETALHRAVHRVGTPAS